MNNYTLYEKYCQNKEHAQDVKKYAVMIFDASAADFARPQREAIHTDRTPSVLSGGRRNLLAPQPRLGARVAKGQFLPILALRAKGHEQVVVRLKAALLRPAQRHATAGDAQFEPFSLPALGRQEQPLRP